MSTATTQIAQSRPPIRPPAGPAPQQKLLTLTFLLAPEALRPGEEKDNPLGLRITHMTLTPYVGVNPGAAQ